MGGCIGIAAGMVGGLVWVLLWGGGSVWLGASEPKLVRLFVVGLCQVGCLKVEMEDGHLRRGG